MDNKLSIPIYSIEEIAHKEQQWLDHSMNNKKRLNQACIAVRYDRYTNDIIVDRAKESFPDKIGSCVFKLTYNDKYLFVKGKSFIGAMLCISRGLKVFANKTTKDNKIDNIYYHLFVYVIDNPDYEFGIDMILVSDNPYKLLVKEQKCLTEGRKDPNCLNNTIDAYVPAYREETGMYGWINKGYYLNFLKWKKRNKTT